jgi:N-acetylglucosaminyldiphosphoundecaprenol N-acetyl-beta-D-mannosaminyltransferase
MSTPQRAHIIFGLPLDPLTMSDVVSRCEAAIKARKRLLIGVVNAAKIVKLRQNMQLRDSILECDVVVADGQSVVWASKLLHKPLPERIAGIDLFEQLLAVADRDGLAVYLLGAKEQVLTALIERVRTRFPGLHIAGSHNGYFDDTRAGEIAADIRNSGADMLFLGMVSPKKEIFLGTWGATLDVPVLHGVGGSFDILAGVTKRAPALWRRLGCEWLYRLLQEPGRLWWRYTSTNVVYIGLTLRELYRPQLPYPHPATTPAPGAGRATS